MGRYNLSFKTLIKAAKALKQSTDKVGKEKYKKIMKEIASRLELEKRLGNIK